VPASSSAQQQAASRCSQGLSYQALRPASEYTARESKDLVLFAVKNEKAEDGKTKKK